MSFSHYILTSLPQPTALHSSLSILRSSGCIYLQSGNDLTCRGRGEGLSIYDVTNRNVDVARWRLFSWTHETLQPVTTCRDRFHEESSGEPICDAKKLPMEAHLRGALVPHVSRWKADISRRRMQLEKLCTWRMRLWVQWNEISYEQNSRTKSLCLMHDHKLVNGENFRFSPELIFR